jgi:glycosyltransferase involved in cell wall biosynthesis
MRLMILCLSSSAGGMELDALRMAERLGGNVPTVFTCRPGVFIHRQSLLAGVRPEILGGSEWCANKILSPRLILGLRHLLKKLEISHIIFFGTSELRSIAIAAWGLDIKIFLRHGTTVSTRKFGGWWREFGYRRVDAYLATSKHIATNVKHFFPVSSNAHVRVIYPVVDSSSRPIQKQFSGSSAIQIVYHSRFARGKGHPDAILATRSLLNAGYDFKFVMVGDFSDQRYVDELRDLIRVTNLEARCELLPFDSDVKSRLASADIFLAPSYGEGFSNSFAEALTQGLVCIVYDNTVFPEYLQLGFKFFMVRNGSVDDLSTVLLAIVSRLACHQIEVAQNVTLARSLFSSERELVEIKALCSL